VKSLSLYFHIPFCKKKCHYCSFYSKGCENANSDDENRFITVILEELKRKLLQFQVKNIPTIFIGGGTPSSLTIQNWERLLRGIKDTIIDLNLINLSEWTVEVNPESLTKEKLDIAQKAGVDRISMGVQSFDPDTLNILGRGAGPDEIHGALELLSQYWTKRWSADLICEIPGQTVDDAINDWNKLKIYNPPHLSLYTLSIEEGTVLERKITNGSVPSDVDEDIWPTLIERLNEDGWNRYEVSNFHRSDSLPSLHNLAYWKMKPFLGVGPGAVSTLKVGDEIFRRENPHDLTKYIMSGTTGIATKEVLTPINLFMDHLLMGLRLRQGFEIAIFERVFSVPLEAMIPKWLKSNSDNNNIILIRGILKMSDAGELFLNSLLVSALEEAERNQSLLNPKPLWG